MLITIEDKNTARTILELSKLQQPSKDILLQMNEKIPEIELGQEMLGNANQREVDGLMDGLLIHSLLATKDMTPIEGEIDLKERFQFLASLALETKNNSNLQSPLSKAKDMFDRSKFDGMWFHTGTKYARLSSVLKDNLTKRKKKFRGNKNSAHLAFWGQIALTSLVGSISHLEGIPPSGLIVGIFAAFSSLGMYLSPTIHEANSKLTEIEAINKSIAFIEDPGTSIPPQLKVVAIKKLITLNI